MKWFSLLCLLALCQLSASAQDTAVHRLMLPDIPGYTTLKCDFHMHTVFSDGHVWPSFRVHEAVRDGLDVISITEHIDFEGYPDEIKKDYNKSFEIAAGAEKKIRNGEPLLLIHLYNRSDLPYKIKASAAYDIEKLPLGQTLLPPHDTTTITLKAVWTWPATTRLGLEVLNVLISPEEALHTELLLKP